MENKHYNPYETITQRDLTDEELSTIMGAEAAKGLLDNIDTAKQFGEIEPTEDEHDERSY